MEHTLEDHVNKLNNLCRICGDRTVINSTTKKTGPRAKRQYRACDSSKQILFVFRINVLNDSRDKHSENICRKCFEKMKRCDSVSEDTIEQYSKTVEQSAHLWVNYNPESTQFDCLSCNHFNQQSCFGKNRIA